MTDRQIPDRKNVDDLFALTPLQAGMLFHYLKEPHSRLYFEQLCLEIHGSLDRRIFERVWNEVVDKNEMLRAVFRWEGLKQPVQVILKRRAFKSGYYDLTRPAPFSSGPSSLEEIKKRDRQEKFDLRQVPFKITLVKVAEDRSVMIVSHHHILYDGWSSGIIIREFFAAYDGCRRGGNFPLPPKTKFKQFVRSIRRQNRDRRGQEKFWHYYLADFAGGREFPAGVRSVPDDGDTGRQEGNRISRIYLSGKFKARLEKAAQRCRVTPAVLFMTAWGLLLQRHGNCSDVVFGTTLSGRTAPVKGIEDMVGLFINTLPLRIKCAGGEGLADLLLRINRDLRQREAYSGTPLVEIASYSGLPRNRPLFDTLVVVENYPLDTGLTRRRRTLWVESHSISAETQYDLTLAVTSGAKIELVFSYAGSRYDQETVRNLARRFVILLTEMVHHPHRPVPHLCWLSPAEKERLLFQFNRTVVPPPPFETVSRWFGEQVRKTPDFVAAVGVDSSVSAGLRGGSLSPDGDFIQSTYTALDDRARCLALMLRERGGRTGTLTALLVKPSLDMAAAILGTLEAGAAYLPLDPAYPPERIRSMLADSRAAILVTTPDEVDLALTFHPDVVRISGMADTPPGDIFDDAAATSPAYIIYTSGTTGRPKGVAVGHAGLVNYIGWRLRAYDYTSRDVSLQMLSYCFDGFAADFYSPLLYGGKLVLAPESKRLEVQFLAGAVQRFGVTSLGLVPGLYDTLVRESGDRELSRLRFVVLAGELAPPALIAASRRKNPVLRHIIEYGPTEATVTAAAHLDIDGDDTAIIGRPIANTRIYILDRFHQPMPIGLPGELFIAGVGLARGYLNRPEATAEKFITLPGFPLLYRTGDLARWHADGRIEFLGRTDHQVKIRGYRLEPGEIESLLVRHPRIKAAVVTVSDTPAKDKYLAAYIVLSPSETEAIEDKSVIRQKLKQYLSRSLPPYMVPDRFIPLPALPLTPGGKIDRRALPHPSIRGRGDSIAPADDMEEEILTFWAEILSLDRAIISVAANFFELGGHSLKAMALISRIHKEYRVDITLPTFFEIPTIRGLADYIRRRSAPAAAMVKRIEAVEERELYPLSSAQRRLYTLQQRESIGTAYNMTTVLRLEGTVDKRRLETACKELVRRHESLRTSYLVVAGEPVQRVLDRVKFNIEYLVSEEADIGIENFSRPFDLSQPPLLRTGLLQMSGNRSILILDLHHICADGISVRLLIRELLALYNGSELPVSGLRYRDFARWQQHWSMANRQLSGRQRAFWTRMLAGELPVLELPYDFSRPAVQGFQGDTVGFELYGRQQPGLHQLAAARGTTLYMVVLAVYLVFLSRMSNQQDILIGTPTDGRRRRDLQDVVGMFVNTLVLRFDVSAQKRFTDFLPEVVGTATAAFANQDVQYEELVELSGRDRDMSRNPLFDTMLVLQEIDASRLDVPGLKLRLSPFEDRTSKFDILLHCLQGEEQVRFKFEYSTNLFKKATIRRFIDYFRRLVDSILTDPSCRLMEIDILSRHDRERLLSGWNQPTAVLPANRTIHRLFERQAGEIPDNISLIGPFPGAGPAAETRLTYRQLTEEADRLAYRLHLKGVGPGSIVALMTDRSVEMITGILGILKAGAAYMPVDPEYPAERIRYMLTDSSAGVLVTNLDRPVPAPAVLIELLEAGSTITGRSRRQPLPPDRRPSPSAADSLAYVIYTSGTTGRPKGVLIPHLNVVRLLLGEPSRFVFNRDDVWTLFHSYCFDFSVWEMYGALLYGGKLIVVSRLVSRDPRLYWRILWREGVTILNQTPSAFYQLMAEALKDTAVGICLRYVIFGGEALSPARLEEWHSRFPGVRLVNMFGITETTVHVTYKEIGAGEIRENTGSIGEPIPAWTTLIMDRYLRPVPAGVAGELCVGGAGVARGYLNQPELTAEKFVDGNRCRCAILPRRSAATLYRSGDRARRRVDGDIEYLGRIDNQVKIRGHRIELAEIEQRLRQHEAVREAAVVARQGRDQDKFLAAYYVVSPAEGPDRFPGNAEFRDHLSRLLPGYMIPAYFIRLQRIPLTANGKLDRRHLPDPEALPGGGEEGVKPRTDMERRIAAIWSGILGQAPSAVNESFFHCGGDSIRAIRLIGQINSDFRTDLKVKDVYARPTIAELAVLVSGSRQGYVEAEIREVEGEIQALKREILADHRLPKGDGFEDIYPMNDIERGLVFYYMKNTSVAVYHDQFIYPLRYPRFDVQRFMRAVELLADRHEILRTSFHIDEFPDSVQIVHRRVSPPIAYHDITHLPGRAAKEKFVREFLEEDRRHPFRAAVPPLWRLGVFCLDEVNIWIALIMHHAILDGWSTASLMTELHNTYLALESNPRLSLPRLESRYRDVVVAEMIEKRRTDNREFWLRELTGYRRLVFPRVLTREDQFAGMKTFTYKLGGDFLAELKGAARRYRATIKDICFAAYIYMLSMLCNENDVVAGCVNHNRPQRRDGDKVLGCFLNTVPVRIRIPPYINGGDYLRLVSAKMLALKQYERLSLFEIARIIGERSRDRNPLFDTLFNFVDFHIFFEADSVDPHALQEAAAAFSLQGNQDTNTLFDFEISITFGDFFLSPKYNDQAVSEEMVRRSCVYFERILRTCINDPGARLNKNDIMPPQEKNRLLAAFNDTAYPYDRNRLLHELFEIQVDRRGDSTAVAGALTCADSGIDGGQAAFLTYRRLNHRADQVAGGLRESGFTVGSLAAVVMERGAEMVEAVMGILKAGGAYVPLEPFLPDARIRKLLDSLNVEYLLTSPRQLARVEGIVRHLPVFRSIFRLRREYPFSGEKPDLLSRSDATAYVIFTSGSTGTPKGVTVRHRPVVNVIQWVNRSFGVGPGDKLIFVSSLGFDLSVYDVFGILAGGACCRVVADTDLREPRRLLEIILRESVTFWDSAPAALQQLLPFLPEIRELSVGHRFRLIFLSGDWIPVTLPDLFKEAFPGLTVIGLGGATEAAIWSNYYPIGEVDPAWPSIPYGKPIQNAGYYILDLNLHLCPLLVPGDLYIGGGCLASGYINEVEVSAAKFIDNPYVSGERMYRTGDLARWLPDGNMEFLGRRDQQVKIRGYRIELGEIESQLLKHPAVEEAVAVVHEGRRGDQYLTAYFVFSPGKGLARVPGPEELKEYLSRELPGYMIPRYFMQISQVPMTPNGKLDRRALPQPEVTATSTYAMPENRIHRQLADIWGQILGVDSRNIGIDADFFELGGHSLNAAVVVSKIHKELQVKLPLRELFHRSTIRQLAEVLGESAGNGDSGARPMEATEYCALSSAQKRLYVLQQMDPANTVYNIPQVVRLKGVIDRNRLFDSFQKLIRRHQSFRTAFIIVGGEPVQRIRRRIIFNVEDYDSLDGDPSAVVSQFIRPFDLSEPPLLRVGLIREPNRNQPSQTAESQTGEQILILDMHHIVADGASMGILIREFTALYQGSDLSPLKLQYRDFAAWQQRYRRDESFRSQESFWRHQFVDQIPLLVLPTDLARPELQDFNGAALSFRLEGEMTARLYRLALQQKTTLYTVLLTVFYIFLHKLGGQEDIVVGTPVEGRRQADFADTIGMFVNTLALRNFPTPDQVFSGFLQRVREQTVAAFDNQDYPFEELVEGLELRRDLNRNPLFDVMLAMQNMEMPEMKIPGLSLAPFPYEIRTAKFDLTLTVVEREGHLDLLLEYASTLFHQSTVERFIRCFKKIADRVTKDASLMIGEIDIIGAEEKRRIVEQFNDTERDYPRDTFIHEFLVRQALKTPHRLAVVGPEIFHVTYRKLDELSRRLARRLRTGGARPGTVVALMTARSLEMMIGVFGVLRNGTAYLPIDPGYPAERIRFMLRDGAAGILLTETMSAEGGLADVPGLQVLGIGDILDGAGSEDPPEGWGDLSNTGLAYVIYTSGTTGRPKGTAVEHPSLVNRIHWMQRQYPLDQADTILHKTPFTFDVSVWEIVWWSMAGARVCLLEPGGEKDPAAIAAAVGRYRVTVMHFVPSMLSLFLGYLEKREGCPGIAFLRLVFASGETLGLSQVERFHRSLASGNGTRLVNLYGPTEAAIDVSYHDCPDGADRRVVPIGRPIDNILLYILDKNLKFQPRGIAGELYIAGVGLARGYLNRPELTAERFIPPPVTWKYPPVTRLYRTGDLCRWLEEGEIEFMGRIDHQVKIRGFRIEPEEIEARLQEFLPVKQVVVSAVADPRGEPVLCAYLVSDEELNVRQLREYLSSRLPEYMVPSSFNRLERIPLTAAGKLDRNSLHLSGKKLAVSEGRVPPRSVTERIIAAVWQEVLQQKEVGIHDNFFDLGGTSMDVIRVGSRITGESGYEIPTVAMYRYTTIAALARFLDEADDGHIDPRAETRRRERRRRGGADQVKIRERRSRSRR